MAHNIPLRLLVHASSVVAMTAKKKKIHADSFISHISHTEGMSSHPIWVYVMSCNTLWQIFVHSKGNKTKWESPIFGGIPLQWLRLLTRGIESWLHFSWRRKCCRPICSKPHVVEISGAFHYGGSHNLV